jgi:tryptophan 7-halogenase
VLYGMEYKTDMEPIRSNYPRFDEARQEFATIQQVAALALKDLPDHRALVEHMCSEYHQRVRLADTPA